ncbi:hypothetical protein PDE_04730 [Penicillium oxalicum 114-2]|uniref:Uncharacterized protein n=1 Tax=Penicillium oxalicum (strain 114-2 / CGMCC 5302) TaxID=933388 RepID=S7ZGG6_PENO1|nr:hypothetical protein PDE_04730 [Penicillium oxalicum 114-2]
MNSGPATGAQGRPSRISALTVPRSGNNWDPVMGTGTLEHWSTRKGESSPSPP